MALVILIFCDKLNAEQMLILLCRLVIVELMGSICGANYSTASPTISFTGI